MPCCPLQKEIQGKTPSQESHREKGWCDTTGISPQKKTPQPVPLPLSLSPVAESCPPSQEVCHGLAAMAVTLSSHPRTQA